MEDQLGALKDLQAEGKIRHIGLSEVSVQQIQHARTIAPIVSIQNRYSLVDRGSEDVLEYCEKEKVGFIPWFPLAAGQLSSGDSPIRRMAEAVGSYAIAGGSGLAAFAISSPFADPGDLKRRTPRTKRCRGPFED